MSDKTAPLYQYNPDEPVTLTCDASQKDIPGILEQNGHPVMAVSKILTKAEQSYTVKSSERL